MNDFIEQYNYNKKTMTKVTKKGALNFVKEMIDRMGNEDTDPYFWGMSLAKLETFFAPSLSPIKNELDWAVQPLSASPNEKRDYCRIGAILPEIGLCCTDSSRLHILLEYSNEKPLIGKDKTWFTLDEFSYYDFSWYPNVKCLLNYTDFEEKEVEVIDINTVKIGDCTINRKFYNQAVSGMKNPVIKGTDNKNPVYIREGNKLAIIMPQTC